MSQSASQAAAFYLEVAEHRRVWTIRDSRGIPAPLGDQGLRVMPFWSSSDRAETVIGNVPAYSGFVPVELSWIEFRDRWLPGLARDELLVGVNWSGARATGYDVEPAVVREAVEAAIARREAKLKRGNDRSRGSLCDLREAASEREHAAARSKHGMNTPPCTRCE